MTRPQLDYGRDEKSQRWREVRRWIVRALISAAIVIVGVVVIPRLSGRLHLISCVNRCLSYVAPANQVAYVNDPVEMTKQLQQGGGFRDLRIAGGNGVGFSPHVWNEQQQYGTVGGWPHAILFLHERVSKNGVRRLVCVTYHGGTHAWAISI